jgi:hypothetical protein
MVFIAFTAPGERFTGSPLRAEFVKQSRLRQAQFQTAGVLYRRMSEGRSL